MQYLELEDVKWLFMALQKVKMLGRSKMGEKPPQVPSESS
jgi:hypothetical protein